MSDAEALSKLGEYMITKYHAKYYANILTQKSIGGSIDSISQSLLNAAVDINPHQIEAALFAFRSPLSKGVILADEVGLGKTIEVGLVICQTGQRESGKLSLYVQLHYVSNGVMN
ncbi:hypothetical protein NLX71_24975 [Paenibacillus sp. MZ04-78.2]|uniref:hypothetical protein n=1 Tax=Paenibacillus sp. MZ04-78.2 TaxID=2962034 RepID=UPI0020B80A8E|nr:hypothetical protein [Paenibacillus sp. MZ04-78.2]MCP3776502.1 hypothetical protein [Paenibacillus sp. MZ04-78.2]